MRPRWRLRLRRYGAVLLMLCLTLMAAIVATWNDTRIDALLNGRVNANREAIDATGKTLGDLEAQVERNREAIVSLEARLNATPACSLTPSAIPRATARPSARSTPTVRPTARPSSPPTAFPTALPTLCVDDVVCVTLRPILTAC